MLAKKSKKIHSQEKVSTVAGLKSASQIRDLMPYPLGYTAGVDQDVLFKNVLRCRQQLWCDRQIHGGQTLKTNDGRLT